MGRSGKPGILGAQAGLKKARSIPFFDREADLQVTHVMHVLSRLEKTMLVVVVAYSFIPTFGGLFRVFELTGGPAIIPANPRALADPFPISAHILASFVFCIAGALQFLPSLRRHRPAVHRHVGRAVAVAGCVSAATGVWMTHFYAFPTELQGALLYWVRIVVGLSMIVLIGRAVTAVRSRNVFAHSAAMLRAYAIGQGASTQTFLGMGWMLVSGTELVGPTRDMLMVTGWLLNLVVAEVVIGRFLARKRASTIVPQPNRRTRMIETRQ